MCLQAGYTPFALASREGHVHVVKLLLALEGGEELVKAKNTVSVVGVCVCIVTVGLICDCCGMCLQNGYTPLMSASREGHAHVVKLLLALEGGEELAKAKDGVSVVGEACVW
jgi:ankyrin repeat protein